MVRAALLAVLCLAPSLSAQWNPAAGQWGKTDPADLRVMSWNVEDGLCSSNTKQEAFDDWTALVMIVASLQPDVLILQETADNSGNGTGSGVDSVADLTGTIELFFHGGLDPFNGNALVTAYVQKYAPGYDLPFIYVSSATDGFNRNVTLSRFPFGDVNGDGVSTAPDFLALADLYAQGFNGGIRGFAITEIDLPDGVYAGDMVIGNSHLKAGGSSSDKAQRLQAAQNIAYLIDALYNGLGTGTADPNAKVLNPSATQLPSAETLIMAGGDWNEDEVKNGATRGPAAWITEAAVPGGIDGTDRDRSDMTYDAAADLFNGSTSTLGSSKLDYLAWQDSIATERRSWVFNTSTVPLSAMPPELATYPINPQLATGFAADHRPVIVDLILPLADGCSPLGTDLGFAKAGTGGVEPVLSACGSLGTGETADVLLEDALPGSSAFLVFSLDDLNQPFSGGTLVPVPDFILGPLPVDGAGEVLIPDVPGGGGMFDVYTQFIVQDPGASFGRSFSNGLLLPFSP